MYLWVTTLLYVATITLRVESRCYNVNPMTVDYDHLCVQWWEEGYHQYSYIDGARWSCIKLIIKKCPQMITVTSSTSRNHDGEDHYETWTTSYKATLTSNTDIWMTYEELEKKSVCYDDGVQECDYWWNIAKDITLKNKKRQVCIDNIWNHCRSKITKECEGKTGEVTSCSTAYDVNTVTYNYGGETTTINKYVPV